MELFVKRAPQQVVDAMRQTVANMIGTLPPQFFTVTVTTVAENLAQLMYSVFMTGYMFRNAQYRLELQQGLEQVALPEVQDKQMNIEVQSWPYNFPASEDFPPSDQRGQVSGRLLVQDRYISKAYILPKGAHVGLAPLGDVGSWQRECKGYQFWTTTDGEGYFTIKNIREGNYNLFASVPSFIGDYRYDVAINVTAGSAIDMGDLVYEPPRDGSTLWEIGIADRSAAEFYVSDPNPMYINKLYVNHPDRFRQYGLWERYTDLYPDEDLAYTIGVSDYKKDWFFAQVTRCYSGHLKPGNAQYCTFSQK